MNTNGGENAHARLHAGDRLVTEDNTPFAPHGRTKALERHLAGFRTKEDLMLHTDGIEGIALRFGALYGPGFARGGTDQIVARAHEAANRGRRRPGRSQPA